MKSIVSAFCVAALGVASVASAQVEVDPSLPTYTAARGAAVSGTVKSVGSDTMNNLMTLWGEQFRQFYPAVQIEIEGKGSSTAPTALIEGAANFGPMSRPMKASEVDKFEAEFGYKPTALRTGIDALAVYVHKDNPITELSLEQVQSAFSVSGPEMTWGDLGVEDARWKNRPVSLYGRNSASGTYGYFKEVALGGNDYKASVKEQPGSSAVVQSVGRDMFGMGYSGLGYMTADVKAVPLSAGGEAFAPTAENASTGDYPLARFLYVYINYAPGSQIDPLRGEFAKLIFSRQGQEVVIKDGYFPVPVSVAAEELENLGLTLGAAAGRH